MEHTQQRGVGWGGAHPRAPTPQGEGCSPSRTLSLCFSKNSVSRTIQFLSSWWVSTADMFAACPLGFLATRLLTVRDCSSVICWGLVAGAADVAPGALYGSAVGNTGEGCRVVLDTLGPLAPPAPPSSLSSSPGGRGPEGPSMRPAALRRGLAPADLVPADMLPGR